jgi:hypothetical protein
MVVDMDLSDMPDDAEQVRSHPGGRSGRALGIVMAVIVTLLILGLTTYVVVGYFDLLDTATQMADEFAQDEGD